ncbi:MAG: class I SAM-dependent methyltransferase [Chloroflexota bacterium]
MPFDHFGLIAKFYNRVANYTLDNHAIRRIDLPTRGKLLDVGGGTGRLAAALIDQVDLVIVSDPSQGMLAHAAQKELDVVCATAESLPYPEACFSRIVMLDVLHHVHDQGVTIADLWRVLEPGGRLVIVEPDIHKFGVKLIAIAEKVLLMRSHFLSGEDILSLVDFPGAQHHLVYEENNVWIILMKADQLEK